LEKFLLSAWDMASGHQPSGNMSCSEALPSPVWGWFKPSKLQELPTHRDVHA
jgi:hypothetical protein